MKHKKFIKNTVIENVKGCTAATPSDSSLKTRVEESIHISISSGVVLKLILNLKNPRKYSCSFLVTTFKGNIRFLGKK